MIRLKIYKILQTHFRFLYAVKFLSYAILTYDWLFWRFYIQKLQLFQEAGSVNVCFDQKVYIQKSKFLSRSPEKLDYKVAFSLSWLYFQSSWKNMKFFSMFVISRLMLELDKTLIIHFYFYFVLQNLCLRNDLSFRFGGIK